MTKKTQLQQLMSSYTWRVKSELWLKWRSLLLWRGEGTHTVTDAHRHMYANAQLWRGTCCLSCSDKLDNRQTGWSVRLHSHTHADVDAYDIIGKCCRFYLVSLNVCDCSVPLFVYSVVIMMVIILFSKARPDVMNFSEFKSAYLHNYLMHLCSRNVVCVY